MDDNNDPKEDPVDETEDDFDLLPSPGDDYQIQENYDPDMDLLVVDHASTSPPPPEKSVTIPAPYLWARDRPCSVYSLTIMRCKNISLISGKVHCNKCNGRYSMAYHVATKFNEIDDFLRRIIRGLRRTPEAWMNPVLLNCQLCKQEKCVGPVIDDKKKKIDWLFLFLSQWLGFCSVSQLKYFCKHTNINIDSNAPKDRLLILVYLELCRQLKPAGPFAGWIRNLLR